MKACKLLVVVLAMIISNGLLAQPPVKKDADINKPSTKESDHIKTKEPQPKTQMDPRLELNGERPSTAEPAGRAEATPLDEKLGEKTPGQEKKMKASRKEEDGKEDASAENEKAMNVKPGKDAQETTNVKQQAPGNVSKSAKTTVRKKRTTKKRVKTSSAKSVKKG